MVISSATTVSLTSKRGTAHFVASEIGVQDRPAILTAYRAKLGRMVEGYFRQLPSDVDHPVFALTAA